MIIIYNLYKMFYKQVPMMSYDIVLNYLQIPTRILTLIKIHSAV